MHLNHYSDSKTDLNAKIFDSTINIKVMPLYCEKHYAHNYFYILNALSLHKLIPTYIS